jgi:hypothetical protein
MSTARADLKNAVSDVERARGKLRRSQPERAIEMWTGLNRVARTLDQRKRATWAAIIDG